MGGTDKEENYLTRLSVGCLNRFTGKEREGLDPREGEGLRKICTVQCT